MSDLPQDDRTRLQPAGAENPGAAGSSADFKTGDIIAGSYKVLAFIGRGGMGTVYRIHHLFLDKELALKTLTGDISEIAWKRFQIEGQVIAKLNHPNIIRIYDLGVIGLNQPYYVMDLVEGLSLAQVLQDEGALSVADALPIFRQLAAGLAYAHEQGVIHRDLKPANIMLLPGENQKSLTAKILDFGLAKLTDLTTAKGIALTKTGEVFGSPLYMSPEQAQGLPVDQTTDIFSFGYALFEALTGEVPLRGKTAVETMMLHASKDPPGLSELNPAIDFGDELETFVARLIARDKNRRYQSFNHVAQALLAIERPAEAGLKQSKKNNSDIRNQDGEEMGESISDRLRGIGEGKPWLWPVATLLGLLLIGVSGWGAYNALTPHTRTNKVGFLTADDASKLGEGKKAEAGPGTNIARPDAEMVITGKNVTDGEKFYSRLVGSGPSQMRVFDFPAEPSLGRITYDIGDKRRHELSDEWRKHNTFKDANDPYRNGFRAKGHLEFRADDKLRFDPTEELVSTPFLFKKFRPDDFTYLDCHELAGVDSDFLQYIKHMTALQKISVSDTDVDNRALRILTRMPNLGMLCYNHTAITGKALIESGLLKKLKIIELANTSDYSMLLATLKNSPDITSLTVNTDPLSTEDLKSLASMPILKTLNASGCGITDDGLKILLKSKSLEQIDLNGNPLSVASLPTIENSRLRTLGLSSGKWTAADRAKHVQLLDRMRHRSREDRPPKGALIGN